MTDAAKYLISGDKAWDADQVEEFKNRIPRMFGDAKSPIRDNYESLLATIEEARREGWNDGYRDGCDREHY